MKKWHWAVLALLTIASIIADIVSRLHGHEAAAEGAEQVVEHVAHWWSFPGFWILFGAIGCAVLILFAKKFLGLLVLKKEDYYHE